MNSHTNQHIIDQETFTKKLKTRLMDKLPGSEAHLKMASKLRLDELRFDYDSTNATRSSVLILLYPVHNKLNTVFILRQKYNGVHSGQVSFPGGRKEKDDRSLIETALRESNEEVNINPKDVEILGTLSELYIPPSNFLVLPVIGFQPNPPNFIADKSEVAEIIETSLDFLFDRNLQKETTLIVRGTEIEAPYFDINSNIVWGATAMILSELKEVIESIG